MDIKKDWQTKHQPFELNYHIKEGIVWRSDDKEFKSRWKETLDWIGDMKGKKLDVGCGPRSPISSGVVIEPLLDNYKLYSPKDWFKKMKCYSQSAEEYIPELENQFDFVLCWNCLDHVYDWQSILNNIHRYMKKNAKFVLGVDLKTRDRNELGHPGFESIELFWQVINSLFTVERRTANLWDRDLVLELKKKELKKLKDVTFIIKTFDRPESLYKLMNSIDYDVPILIANDGKQQVEHPKATVYELPFDTGLSAGRNFLLDKVKTKYFLLLDDDFVFTKKTKIEELVKVIEKGFDIVSGYVEGHVYNHTIFKIKDNVLIHDKIKSKGKYKGYPLYDLVLNFFVGRTRKIRNLKWDDKLKIGEHEDFFLRAKDKKLKVTVQPKVSIVHERNPSSEEYIKYRNRAREEYRVMWMKKHNIKHQIDNSKGRKKAEDRKRELMRDMYKVLVNHEFGEGWQKGDIIKMDEAAARVRLERGHLEKL